MSVLVAFKATGAGADVEGAAGAGICAAGGARLLGSHPAARVSGHPPLIGISRGSATATVANEGTSNAAKKKRRHVIFESSLPARSYWRLCSASAETGIRARLPAIAKRGQDRNLPTTEHRDCGSPALGSFVVSPSLRLKFLARHTEQFAHERLKPIHRRFAPGAASLSAGSAWFRRRARIESRIADPNGLAYQSHQLAEVGLSKPADAYVVGVTHTPLVDISRKAIATGEKIW
jgi:hypothetical protein